MDDITNLSFEDTAVLIPNSQQNEIPSLFSVQDSGVTDDVITDAKNEITRDLAKDLNKNAANEIACDASNEVAHKVSNGVAHEYSNQSAHDVWNVVPKDISNKDSNDVSNEVAHDLFDVVSYSVSNEVTHAVSSEIIHKVSNEVTHDASNEACFDLPVPKVETVVTDHVTNDVTNSVGKIAGKSNERKKRVSFHEPPVIAHIAAVKCHDVIDEVTASDERKVEHVNDAMTVDNEEVKIPEISDLWWRDVDDGTMGEPKNSFEKAQLKIRRFVDNLAVRVFGIFLILLDIVLMIVDLSLGPKPPSTQILYDSLAMTLSCIFLTDLLLRIFSYGPKTFFRSVWEVVDSVVVVVTFGVTVFYTVLDEDQDLGRLVSIARLIRVVRIARIIYVHRHVTESGRRTVSQNKRRYRKDGFDLDLTYVTDNVIAMSFPSSGFQSYYRNPKEEVRRFFEKKYPGKYRVYNLCSERSYRTELFDNRVHRVLIDDHNVPSIADLMDFIKDARDWTSRDPENVIAVHCKGGKGRTGTIICSWLIDQGKFQTAKNALEYFGMRRTDLNEGQTFQGVETASQIRYVGYYEKIKRDFGGIPPSPKELCISRVVIHSIAGVGRGNGSDLSMEIIIQKRELIKCNFGEEYNCKRVAHKTKKVLLVRRSYEKTWTFTDQYVYEIYVLRLLESGKNHQNNESIRARQKQHIVSHNDKENEVICDVINCPKLSGDVKFRFTSSAKNFPRGYDDCAFYFWINTGFVDSGQVILSRDELDNPHKKKTWHIFKEDFSVHLYFKDSSC